MNELIINNEFQLQPATSNKNCVSHLNRYNRWCMATDTDLLQPDLAAYRDNLLVSLSPSSAKVHLSHVRQAYNQLLQNRDLFYQLVPAEHTNFIANQKAYVDEWLTRIKHSINPANAPIKVITQQDSEDDKHLRLTKQQASAYLNSFGTDTLKQLRNTCIVALMLCSGIREAELIALTVDDLRQTLGGDLALRIKSGKGAKQRLIPYGQLSWVLVLIDKYLSLSGIESGKVFPLSVRQIQYIVTGQPVNVDGEKRTVRPHDLRRTYAKLLYLEGMNLKAIADNLGHSNTRTTELYIGVLDSTERQPANLYHFDLNNL